MKILMVVWNYYPNTAYTNHTKASQRGFIENGAECDVLSIKPLVAPDDSCKSKVLSPNASLIKTALGMAIDTFRLVFLSRKYDIIYCACSTLWVVKLTQRLSRMNGTKIVHERTEHPNVFIPDTPKGKKHLKAYCEKVGQFDKVFTISTTIKMFFEEKGVEENRLQVYPMIVDPNRFANVEKKDIGYRYIAYCGNLQNSKDGVADLIQAYAKAKAANSRFKLVLIGKKPTGKDMKLYEQLISENALQNQIVFYGQAPRDDMPQLLKNADILALSRPDNLQARGGFPTKLGEYLATGNPVLVTSVGDIPLYIHDGENGYVSPPDDIDMFAQKLDYIAQNFEEALIVGRKGTELVYNEFNYSVQTKMVLDTLKSL